MTFARTAALMATAICAANAQAVPIEEARLNRGGVETPLPRLGLGQSASPLGLGALAEGPGGLPCAAPFLVTSFGNLGEFNPAAPLLFGGGLVIQANLLLNQLTPGARLFEFSENGNLENGVAAEFSERGEALLFKTFDQNGQLFSEEAVEASRLTVNRNTTITIVVREIDPLAPRPAINGAELFIFFNGVEVAMSLITAPVVTTRNVNLIGESVVEGLPPMDALITDFSLQACEPSLANAAAAGLGDGDDVATDGVVIFLLIAVGILIIVVAGIVVYLVAQPSRAAAAPASKASSSKRSSSRRSSSRRSSSRRSKSKSGQAVSV